MKTGVEGSVTIGRKLLETLLDHKAASRHEGDDELVFPTSTGRHDNPSNSRMRVLRPAIARANERLAAAKRPLKRSSRSRASTARTSIPLYKSGT